jgi:hypothetical protein
MIIVINMREKEKQISLSRFALDTYEDQTWQDVILIY